MASDWHNASLPCDVDSSGLVEPLDALIVINDLNLYGTRQIRLDSAQVRHSVDVNNDGSITPLDALVVINLINRFGGPHGLSTGMSESDLDGNGVVLSPTIKIVGTTTANSNLAASVGGSNVGSALADELGNYKIELPVGLGKSIVFLQSIDPLGRMANSQLHVERGDVSHDWNASALNVIRAWSAISNDPYEGRIVPSQPPMAARNLAMIQTAMFDALNAIESGFKPYHANLPTAPQGASGIAAAASAAFTVASSLYSGAKERLIWDATMAESLATIADSQSRNLGIAFGKVVGQAMLAARANDGSQASATYTPGSSPGDWNRTYPDYLPPLLPQWPTVTPFVLDSLSDLRPAPPPELTSTAYAAAVDEVMRLGSLQSTERTPEQTEIALFWADGSGTATPPGHWNRIASEVSMRTSHSLLDNARMFALLNLAMADAGIAAWDAKYSTNLWRPIDAIREADTDGNAGTIADTNWLPLLKTPPFPSYVSGHSTFSAAAATVLTSLLGDNIAFATTIDPQNAPSQRPLADDKIITRQFTSFSQVADEAGMSRIYGGIHFAFDNAAGLELGKIVGASVLQLTKPFTIKEFYN